MKDEFKKVSINKFVGLKSKMYWIVSENSEEVNTAKGVNITTVFKEYKNVLFNKKLIIHKMKGIQRNYIKLAHMMSAKYLYHSLMTKDTF